MRKDSNNVYTIGFTGLLQIAFIILKLCHVIDWSWWIVLAPIWGSILFLVLCFIILVWIMK